MRLRQRRCAAALTTALGASLVLSTLAPLAASASVPTEVDSLSSFTNPSRNPLNPGPLNVGDGHLVISPDDPEFAELAQQVVDKLEADSQQVPDAATLRVAPSATVPDPLDFDNQAEDAPDYLIPPAADTYKTGDTYEIGRPIAGGTATGTVAEGLDDFYGQQLNWSSCKDFDPAGEDAYIASGFECAYLIVPVDYNDPAGETAAIGLLKAPALKPDEKKGTIFVDPGGPGGSGMSTVYGTAGDMPQALQDQFDFVGFDPRGVGSSLPMIRCKSSAAFDAQREGSDGLTAAQLNAIQEHNTDECYSNTGSAFGIDGHDFISQVGTVNVVRDLDIARSVVGDKGISYLGYSYGTSIGYQYAMAFPDNIRAMVIDGVVNPFENNAAELAKYSEYMGGTSEADPLDQIKGFQSTFEQFMQKCAAEDGFLFRTQKLPCALGTSGDLNEMMQKYQAISQKAWGGTAYATHETNPRPVSFSDMQQGTILAMYNENFWGYLNKALTDLRDNNDGTWIMILADSYYSRGTDGRYNFSDSAFQTIWCTDAGTPAGANDDPAATIALTERQFTEAPFTNPGTNADGSQRGLEPSNDWCTYYEDQFTLPQGQSMTAMPNVLVVSTTYDPATPYPNGVVAAAGIGGTLLTVAGNSHTSFGGSSLCTDKIVTGYFTDIVVATDIPGDQGVQTKDIRSNVITGDECAVTSFRPTPAIEDASARAGETVAMNASGLVRNTAYTVMLPEGFTLQQTLRAAGDRTATVDGTMQFSVTVPAGTPAGDVTVQLVPADATANDPTVKPTGTLKIVANEQTAQPGDPTVIPSDSATPTNAPGAGDGIAVTGADIGAMPLVIAGILLAAGLALVLARRRGTLDND